MRKRLALFACVLLCSAPWASGQQLGSTNDVDDLVRVGISNNKDLAALRERIAENKGLARQARVRPSPVLDLNGSTGEALGSSGEHSYGAGLSQSIETFSKRTKRVRVADLSTALSEAAVEQRSAQLAYEIRVACAEVMGERRKLTQLAALTRVNREMLRLTEARVKEGDVAPLESSLLKVEISRTEVSRVSTMGRLAVAENELRRLVGLDAAIAIPQIDFPTPGPASLEELKQQALAHRGDLESSRLGEQQQAASVTLAKAEAKPDVTISAAYNRQSSLFDGLYAYNTAGVLSPIRDHTSSLTFGISIPLRTTQSSAGNLQAAASRASQARLLREYLERSIPLEVEAAYQRWRSALDSQQLLQTQVIGPSEANLSVIQEAYKLGQMRLLDVLNEQRRLVDTQMQFIDAQADVARTWADLERASGAKRP